MHSVTVDCIMPVPHDRPLFFTFHYVIGAMCCVVKGIAIDVQIWTVYRIICINNKAVYVYIQVCVYTCKGRSAHGSWRRRDVRGRNSDLGAPLIQNLNTLQTRTVLSISSLWWPRKTLFTKNHWDQSTRFAWVSYIYQWQPVSTITL